MSKQANILQSLQPVLNTMVEAAMDVCDGVAAQAWLVGPGDLCDSCPKRPECPGQDSCLHLVAGAGVEGDQADKPSRIPIGVGTLGRIPTSHDPVVARSGLDTLGLAEPGWITRNKVSALAALPLEHGERCIGVLVVFSPGGLPEGQVRALTATVRLGAEAVGNVAAFRALAAERNRLAARNALLRSGLGLPPEPEPAPPPPPPPPAAAPVPAAAPAPPPPAPIPTMAVLGSRPHEPTPTPVHNFAAVQRDGILRALDHTRWRVSGPKGAAKVLGLKPTTLESKMKKLGIHRPPR